MNDSPREHRAVAGKDRRVRKRSDIDRAFGAGRRSADGTLTVLAVPNGLAVSRLGVGVSSRHGCAVKRNRVKRLCREAFRLTRAELPVGFDFFMLPRPGRTHELTQLRESLRKLCPRAAQQWGDKGVQA